MAIRDLDITERISRAEKDLLNYKNAQTFGKDVTKPKVIQRYNSDGTPTQWDIIGDAVNVGFIRYNVGGLISYTSRTQTSPWASIYAKIRINPTDEIVSTNSVSFTAFADMESVFNGGKTIKFNITGASSAIFGPPSDTTVDRLWIKIYVLANDYGDIKLEVPYGLYGAGTVVPLT